jgi:hypothetical protein
VYLYVHLTGVTLREAKVPILNEKLLNEIYDAFIDAGLNPSDSLLDGLAENAGLTPTIAREHFVSRYKQQTGTDEDPFAPPMGERG